MKPFNPAKASERRIMEQQAELRWRYKVRHENEPRIRELEEVLGVREGRAD